MKTIVVACLLLLAAARAGAEGITVGVPSGQFASTKPGTAGELNPGETYIGGIRLYVVAVIDKDTALVKPYWAAVTGFTSLHSVTTETHAGDTCYLITRTGKARAQEWYEVGALEFVGTREYTRADNGQPVTLGVLKGALGKKSSHP